MLRRQLRCSSCGDSWERATARFCGSCGAVLHANGTTGRTNGTTGRTNGTTGRDRLGPEGAAADRVSPQVLVLGGLVVLAVVGALLTVEIDLGTPRTADDGVALPDELDAPAQLTPDQRESLERFEPDRLRCEPHGCEVARLHLDTAAALVVVDHGRLVVLDGTVLRMRSLDHLSVRPRTDHEASVEQMTSEVTGGAGASRRRDPPTNAYDRDLADLRELAGHLDVAATPPEALTVLADGSVILRWFDRLVRLDDDGTLRWELTGEDRTFRHLEVVDDRLLVLRDDLPWPGGTTGPRSAPDPVLATVLDPDDGQELWSRYTLSPRDVMGDGLLVTTVDGSIEMLEMATGESRWRRSRASSDRLQSTSGPWLILTHHNRATLIDPRTGDEVAVRENAALLTPLRPIDDLWVAAWLEGSLGGGGTIDVALVALDDQGTERWRVPLRSLGGGACCPAAIPWGDDTLAVFDPGGPAPQWLLVDTPSGGLVGRPEKDRPHLPLPYDASHRIFVPGGGDRLLQSAEDRAALLSSGGQVLVQGSLDLEVVSVDPFVVVQGREVLVAHPVPIG